MSDTKDDPRRKLRHIVDALDDEPPSAEEAAEVVRALGADIPAIAARLRAKIAAAPATEEARKRAELRRAYERERAAATTAAEPVRPRAEQLAIIRGLLARAGERAVALHYRKFDEATDEELADLVTTLRRLVADDDPE